MVMLRENHVAKQQGTGQRLMRAMARAHMGRRELAELTGYGEAQIALWERGGAPLYPAELIKTVPCARRDAGVAAVLGSADPLITPAQATRAA